MFYSTNENTSQQILNHIWNKYMSFPGADAGGTIPHLSNAYSTRAKAKDTMKLFAYKVLQERALKQLG